GRDRPTIINDRQYEALREQGMSKNKAARIANSDPREMARNRKDTGSYEEWTKDQLLAKAREIEMPGRSSMNKRQLIAALRK
ncbi:MAG: Rho termination factor N-terminal domain-containing protein, partial [Dehalococcoidia bacterium]